MPVREHEVRDIFGPGHPALGQAIKVMASKWFQAPYQAHLRDLPEADAERLMEFKRGVLAAGGRWILVCDGDDLMSFSTKPWGHEGD